MDHGERGVEIQRNRAKLDFLAVAKGPSRDFGQGKQHDSRLAFRMIDEDPVAVVVSDYADSALVQRLLDQVRGQKDRPAVPFGSYAVTRCQFPGQL